MKNTLFSYQNITNIGFSIYKYVKNTDLINSMKAETAYNVIQALTPLELTRLYTLLGIDSINHKKNKKKDDDMITVTQATEDLMITLFK